MKITKKEFEIEFRELLLKYRDMLQAGEITESVIGTITCICYCA